MLNYPLQPIKDWQNYISTVELKQPIKAGAPTIITFTADKTGSFKLEVHFVDKGDNPSADTAPK